MSLSRHPWQNAYTAKAKNKPVDEDELKRIGKLCSECGTGHIEAVKVREAVQASKLRVEAVEEARSRAFKKVPSMALFLVEKGKGYVAGNMKMLCWYCRDGGSLGLDEVKRVLKESACIPAQNT